MDLREVPLRLMDEGLVEEGVFVDELSEHVWLWMDAIEILNI